MGIGDNGRIAPDLVQDFFREPSCGLVLIGDTMNDCNGLCLTASREEKLGTLKRGGTEQIERGTWRRSWLPWYTPNISILCLQDSVYPRIPTRSNCQPIDPLATRHSTELTESQRRWVRTQGTVHRRLINKFNKECMNRTEKENYLGGCLQHQFPQRQKDHIHQPNWGQHLQQCQRLRQ